MITCVSVSLARTVPASATESEVAYASRSTRHASSGTSAGRYCGQQQSACQPAKMASEVRGLRHPCTCSVIGARYLAAATPYLPNAKGARAGNGRRSGSDGAAHMSIWLAIALSVSVWNSSSGSSPLMVNLAALT